jgi:hypothetical protein
MKTNPEKDLMVTPEALGVCGSVSYWRASGTVSIAAMAKAWDAAGLDMVLFRKAPEPETALRRAVLDLATRETIDDKTERRILIRPQKEPSTWAVVEEIVQEGAKPLYATLEIISFVEGAGPQFYTVSGTKEHAAQILSVVMANYSAQQGLFAPEDITGWLVKLAYANGAVTLRDSGGVYFIPRPAMEFWNKAADAIQSVSNKNHQIFRIPAMRNAEAIEAITEAITAEAVQISDKIDAEVFGDVPTGNRAVETRRTAVDALLTKLASYEQLIGAQLSIRERVENLGVSLTQRLLIDSAVPADSAA